MFSIQIKYFFPKLLKIYSKYICFRIIVYYNLVVFVKAVVPTYLDQYQFICLHNKKICQEFTQIFPRVELLQQQYGRHGEQKIRSTNFYYVVNVQYGLEITLSLAANIFHIRYAARNEPKTTFLPSGDAISPKELKDMKYIKLGSHGKSYPWHSKFRKGKGYAQKS